MDTESSNKPLILVIDDVSPVVRLIELELMTQGFRTASILIGDNPVQTAVEIKPAAVVLGSSLPAPPVYEICSNKREPRLPPSSSSTSWMPSDCA